MQVGYARFSLYVTKRTSYVVRPRTELLSLIMVNYVVKEEEVVPEPNFDLSPRARRIVYGILGTIIVCVAIFLTYQVIKTKIEKRAAQREKDLRDEEKASRVDKYRQNQADETMGTIARINKALEQHEQRMGRVRDMVTDIARNLNIHQVRELREKIEQIANNKTISMDEIQEMIDEMKKRTPRAIQKLEEARDLLTNLVEEKGKLKMRSAKVETDSNKESTTVSTASDKGDSASSTTGPTGSTGDTGP